MFLPKKYIWTQNLNKNFILDRCDHVVKTYYTVVRILIDVSPTEEIYPVCGMSNGRGS